ncbi:MAG TPA: hypothetical protein VGR26_14935 [Acidimicrobiales bacterium]|nr:hypothetical protein [Acidimicrobiales bacterium]
MTAVIESHRPHGTYVKYVVERCKCDDCREANRLYELKRRRAMSRPDELWLPYVPAGRARRHVQALSAAGVGHKTVAKVSGVAHGTIAKLIYGDPKRNMGPSRRIRPETERRLLAVTPENAADCARVPAGPTWELLNDLIGRGFTKGWLAQELGNKSPALQIKRTEVYGRTARAVAALHKRLEGQRGPGRRSRWT